MNIFSPKTISKILFDDVIVTSLHLSATCYNQKIEDAKMINCSNFHQVQVVSSSVCLYIVLSWTERRQKSLDWIGLKFEEKDHFLCG